MSLRDDRQRRRDEQQQRALVAMQDGVLAAIGAKFPAHGPDSTVVGEAVADAHSQLILAGEYHGDLDKATRSTAPHRPRAENMDRLLRAAPLERKDFYQPAPDLSRKQVAEADGGAIA